MDSLNEALKPSVSVEFKPSALIEIERMASTYTSLGDKDQIEKKIVNFFLSRRDKTDARNRMVVTRDDVITYEISQKLFDAGIFYFNNSTKDFVRITADEMGLEGRDLNDPAYQDMINDEEDEEEEEEEDLAEEEEEETLDDEDDSDADASVKQQEKSVAAEIGYTEAVALRQSGKALVRKTVTLTNGERREVMMNPLARLYHLLPPQAIADHVKVLWSAHAMPLLERAEKRGLRGSELHNAVVGAITNFFDQLRLDTCLTDSEINSIQGQFPVIVERASGTEKMSAIKRIESGVHKVIDSVISGEASNRSKGSNLFNYLTQRTMRPEDEMAILTGDLPSKSKVVTSAQQVEIDTSGAVTSKIVAKIAQKIELMMSVENAEMPKNEKFTSFLKSRLNDDTSSILDNVHLATNAEVAGALEGMGVKERGAALSGEDATAWMVNAIDARRGVEEEQVPIVNLSLVRSSPKEGARHFKSVSATVRSGETIETLHNSLRDLSDLPAEFKDQRKQIPTAASVLLDRIKDVLAKIKDQLGNFKSERQDPRFIVLCNSLRDNVANLSGLLEYYSMSGMDILPERSSELKAREKILGISAQTYQIALEITDAIVEARSAMRRKRSDSAIEADIAVFDSQIKLAESEQNETLRSSKQREAQDAIRLLQREKELRSSRVINSTLADAIGAAFKGSPLEESESALDAFNKIELEARIDKQCGNYKSTASRDERGTSRQRETSDFTIELINTRVRRIQRAQRDRLRRITSHLASANHSQTIAASRALTTEAQYEQSVRDTAKSLLSRNKYQMHLLQRRDTIRSILEEYEVAAVPTASDITLGFTFSATLPKQYDRESQSVHRVYTVVGELAKKRNEVQVELQYTDALTGKAESVVVPRSVIFADLKRVHGSADKTDQINNQALARFANALRFSKIAALSQLGRKGLGGVTALPSLDEPILTYFGKALFEYDRDRCTSIINQTGIESIEGSMKSAGFSEDALPTVDADIPITDGTKRALCALADLARRFDIGEEFIRSAKGAIKGKDPVSAQKSAFAAISLIARAGPERIGSTLSQTAADDVDKFLESLPEEDDQRERAEVLLSSVLEVMTQIETARNELDSAQEKRESGFYEDMLVNIPIPVPGKRLLMPGARLTVIPPRRSLNNYSRDVMRLFGITPDSLISRPTRGVISAVQIAAHKAGLFPILDTLASDLGGVLYAHFIEILEQTGDSRERRAQRMPGAGKALCANYVKKILYDTLDPEKTHDSMSSHLTEAAHNVLGPLMPGKIIKGVNIQSINHAIEVQLAQSIKALSIATESAAADALLSVNGVRSLYAVAPCTATFLNTSAFSSSERLLLDVITPPPDEALTFITPGLYNQILGGGVQKSKVSKPGDEFIFSRGSDNLAVIVKFLYDCYMNLKKSMDADKKPEMVIIRRMIKKASKTPNPLETVARQFGISQVKSQDDPRLISAAKSAFNQITAEMSLISDGTESSRLTGAVLDVVYRAAGPNKEEIQQQLDVEKEAEDCLMNMINLIKTIDVTQVSSSSAMLTHAPREVMNIASRQLMTQIVNSLTQQMRVSYGAKSREAKAQYASATRRS